jgi:hypothetical protein
MMWALGEAVQLWIEKWTDPRNQHGVTESPPQNLLAKRQIAALQLLCTWICQPETSV